MRSATSPPDECWLASAGVLAALAVLAWPMLKAEPSGGGEAGGRRALSGVQAPRARLD